VIAAVAAVAIVFDGHQRPSLSASNQSADPSRESASTVRLTNVAAAAGLRFVYQHSPTPEKYFVESVPGGVAVFDYNGDGRPDIFFTNGAKTPSTMATCGSRT
jgi:hypothetical protein